jgi:hypothetical protein
MIAAHPAAQSNAMVLTHQKNQKMIAANHPPTTKIAAPPVAVTCLNIHPA